MRLTLFHKSAPSTSVLNPPHPQIPQGTPMHPASPSPLLPLLPWASPLVRGQALSLSSNHSYFQEGGWRGFSKQIQDFGVRGGPAGGEADKLWNVPRRRRLRVQGVCLLMPSQPASQ
jgi:hypothetical protein